MNLLDSLIMQFAPGHGLERMRARAAAKVMARHFEAAERSRRTMHWRRPSSDANAANAGALHHLRNVARDLVRNNYWARRGQTVIANSTVGWGIVPVIPDDKFAEIWAQWVKVCDADGRNTFYGIQRAVMRALADTGEILVRRRRRLVTDGLPLPLQLELIEADMLDHNLNSVGTDTGNIIIQGVEFNKIGQRVAYHLFEAHPGSQTSRTGTGIARKRVPAEEILHIFRPDRPQQVRGISWFAPVILVLKDFDEYADATLMRQKIAACFAAFVTDPNGAASALGEPDDLDPLADTLEPGMILTLPPGKGVEFGAPPPATDFDGFSKAQLRGIAAGLGITYEALTGDYSNVNYSSGRMGRIEFANNILEWQYDLLIPLLCEPVWRWAQESALAIGAVREVKGTEWTPPPLPMVDPEKDTRATTAAVRAGQMTPSEMVRERGYDPATFWQEYAADLKILDKLGLVFDSDPRRITQAGQAQPPEEPETPQK